MKNILLILLFGFTILSCKAQNIVSLTTATTSDLNNNNYIKDVNGKLNPFIGTWKWIDGNSELTIVLIKKEMYDFAGMHNYKEDMIMGGYKYIENGVEIVNTLNFTTEFDPNDISTFNNYTPIISSISAPFTEIYIQFFDKVKDKSCGASFELLDALEAPDGTITATQAQWKMWNKEHYTREGESPQPLDFSIPNNITLTKQ